MSQEEMTVQSIEQIREELKGKTHQELLDYVRKAVESEGLIIFKAHGVFSHGFIPDVITNVDGTRNGWVLIDVINSQESVLHDVAGLLVVKANVEDIGQKVKAVLCVVSDNVDDTRFMKAFLRQYPEVILFRIYEIRAFIRHLRKQCLPIGNGVEIIGQM